MLERKSLIKDRFMEAQQAAVLAARYEAERVQNHKSPWKVYGSTIHEYEARFKRVLGVIHPADFCRTKKDTTGSVYALEVCGDGESLRSIPGLDGGVAITLGDFRSVYQKNFDKEHGLELIVGDVLSRPVWKQVENFLRDNGKEGFDFITMSPVGGWETMGGGQLKGLLPEIEWLVVNRLWMNLCRQGGIALVQFMSRFPESIELWSKRIKSDLGVEAVYAREDQALMLVRRTVVPRGLPKF